MAFLYIWAVLACILLLLCVGKLVYAIIGANHRVFNSSIFVLVMIVFFPIAVLWQLLKITK
jgi:hypothetical protein